MFLDLNIPYQGFKTDSVISMAAKLGYGGVALNHTVIGSFEPKGYKALPNFKTETPTTESLSLITSAQQQQQQPPSSSSSSTSAPIKKYRRLTVVLNDASQIPLLNSNASITDHFDLVAVQPTDEKTFFAACASANVDIISLDVSTRLSYSLRPAIIHQATVRDIYFEINYSASLRDPATLRHFIGTAVTLVRATRGSYLILSSGALSDMELRSPKDIANLCSLFGLAFSNGKETVQKAPQAVILHGELRSFPHGILKIVESEGPSWKKITESELLPTGNSEPKPIKSKGKNKKKNQNKNQNIEPTEEGQKSTKSKVDKMDDS